MQIKNKIHPLLLVLISYLAYGQEQFVSNYMDLDGVKIHYLDFGGEGLPIILIHSEGWDANTFQEFGSMLKGKNRVLAITRPGYGVSEPLGYDVASQANAIISFARALGIEKAVFIGNGSTTCELTYLGENYPEQVAGLIYLNGLATPWLDIYDQDPNRAFEMFRRASPGPNDKKEITVLRKTYRPEYLNNAENIQVPALALVNANGLTGSEKGIAALALVGSSYMAAVRNKMSESPVKDYLTMLADSDDFRQKEIANIKDNTARQFFLKLAKDTSLQKEIFLFHTKKVLPAIHAEQQRFVKAFGENLEMVRLNVATVVGYEYRDAPELILNPMLDFIEKLD